MKKKLLSAWMYFYARTYTVVTMKKDFLRFTATVMVGPSRFEKLWFKKTTVQVFTGHGSLWYDSEFRYAGEHVNQVLSDHYHDLHWSYVGNFLRSVFKNLFGK